MDGFRVDYMKKFFLPLLIFSFALSCSSYSVKVDKMDSSTIKTFTRTGIIIRIPTNYEFTNAEIENNFEAWLAPSIKKKDVVIIKKIDPQICVFESEIDRFYQFSTTGDFQTYKTIGMITIFMRNNEEAIKKIFSENRLDSLLVYEVEAGASATMQYMAFSSTATIIDSQLRIVYLDHQKNSYQVNEWYPETLRKNLMDKVSERLINSLVNLNLIKR